LIIKWNATICRLSCHRRQPPLALAFF
jgi:hypothetical protein